MMYKLQLLGTLSKWCFSFYISVQDQDLPFHLHEPHFKMNELFVKGQVGAEIMAALMPQ